MSRPVITIEGLGKSYRIQHERERYKTFRDAVTRAVAAPWRRFRQLSGVATSTSNGEETFWAVKDVSFDVQQGEVVGIIGRNGAGKSTLLKILSRITEPTEGRAVLHGRVASLLEVGTGFHPELTGRENIYLNGAILGMKKLEIARKFDDIVAFAEIEKFLDTPVKRYSSGMYVRLAFAVAAHLESEILIVDEVLAVGDFEFQQKCLGKMQEVARGQGRTVLFVSHNMVAVRSLCTRGIVLRSGSIVHNSDAADCIEFYVKASGVQHSSCWKREETGAAAPVLAFDSISVSLDGSQPHQQLCVDLRLSSHGSHPPALVAIDFFDPFGSWIMQAVPSIEPFIRAGRKDHGFRVIVDLPPLIPGRYRIGAWAGPDLCHTFDEVREVVEVTIHDSPTPGRTIPHYSNRGFIVPVSSVLSKGNGA